MENLRLVSEAIDAYCVGQSTLPSADCARLEAHTRTHIPMSIMLTGPLVGSLLAFLVQLSRAKRVLEVGCYTGYSALVMAEQLPAGGEVVTLDKNPEYQAIARQFWDQSPHGEKIRFVLGDAKQSIAAQTGPFDMVFIDADKGGYVEYAKRALQLLSPEGIIVADNCLYQGEVLNPETKDEGARGILAFNQWVKESSGLEGTLLPIRDGLYVLRRSRSR